MSEPGQERAEDWEVLEEVPEDRRVVRRLAPAALPAAVLADRASRAKARPAIRRTNSMCPSARHL